MAWYSTVVHCFGLLDGGGGVLGGTIAEGGGFVVGGDVEGFGGDYGREAG